MSRLYLSQICTFLLMMSAPSCTLNGFNEDVGATAVRAPTAITAPASSGVGRPANNVSPAYATPPRSSLAPGNYRLGNGDRIQVTVFGEKSLSGQYLVDGSGNVAMPLISQVAVGGLTTSEAQQTIAQHLRDGYLRRPNVAVQVINYRPFFILGQVQKSGQYPYVSGMNIRTAVAIAGGFTPRARTSKFKVSRPGRQGTRELLLKPTARVVPGDTITVSERFF